jgi:ATP-dependent helicase/nuclease subunit A
MKEVMAMAWTKDQQEAIDSRGQTLLLSAAAGSGKTAVLVERIIRRLLDADHPVDITELLVVTFTKAAAAEMRERVASALTKALAEGGGADVEKQLALLPSAHISTLHSFCQAVIRRFFYRIDVDPKFTVAAEEELGLLRRVVLEDLFLSYYEDSEKADLIYPLTDMFSNDRGDDALMATIERIYDYSRSLAWPDQWLAAAARSYNIPDDAVLDDLPWVAPLKVRVSNILTEQVARYDQVLDKLTAVASLAAGMDQLSLERHQMKAALAAVGSWDELRQAMNDISFERLKAMRKLDDDAKALWEECKAVRGDVKDAVKGLQETYFIASPDEWLSDMRAMAPVMAGLSQVTQDFAVAYSAAKKEKGCVDFSDLEHFCLRILLDESSTPDHPVRSPAALELCQSFQEVLIDEYQDTNGVQELITQLVSKENNRFMVGDIKQSIYRFRLADPTLFLAKYTDFSREADAPRRCIDLSKNFRSDEAILEAVNEVFARAMTPEAAGMAYGVHERLYAGRPACTEANWIGGPIEVHLLDGQGLAAAVSDKTDDAADADETDEAQELSAFEQECALAAQRLLALKAEGRLVQRKDGTMEPLAWHHMVILLRSMKNKSDVMLKALQAAGIPAYADQSGGYFAAIEVEIIMALLRCIDNPEQDLPMAAVLRSPIVGLSEAGLAQLRLSGTGTLWQLLPAFCDSQGDAELQKKIDDFRSSLEQWRTYSRRNSVAELLQRIYDDTAFVAYVGGMAGGPVRQANLRALYDRARQYETAGYRGLFRYLQFLDKIRSGGTDLAPAKVLGEGEDVVRIMSIHKSKGLEFPVVLLADMGKSFNRQDLRSPILFHKSAGIGLKFYDAKWRMFYPTLIWNGLCAQLDWESVAEEERILYVAMTRARDKLILTGRATDLTKQWLRWQSGVVPAQAKTYLDWIMPVLASRPELQALTDSVLTQQDGQADAGLWQVQVRHAVRQDQAEDERAGQDGRLAQVSQGALTQTAPPDWLDAQLSWQYAFPLAVQTAAKLSVSEIKRRYGLEHLTELVEETELAAAVIPVEAEDVFGQVPPWLADGEEAATGAQRGTALHKVMEHIDVASAVTVQAVRDQLAQWQAGGLFTPDEAALVYAPAVRDFCQSPLGRRMAQADEVHREYPFSALFEGNEYLPPVEAGERILIQGVIDCLFREGGQWVIVDYKTDHLDDAEAFRRRYAVQLALYKQAVEQIGGRPVSDVYIYSFHLNKEIALTIT